MSNRHAELLFVLVTVLGAAGWLFSKYALAEFQPHSFLAIRFFLATLVLMAFSGPYVFQLSLKQISQCLVTGLFLGIGLNLWVLGISLTDNIGTGSFVVSLNVVVATLMARIFFAEPIAKHLLMALPPAILGLTLLTLKDGFHIATSQLFFLSSIAGFALHLNLTRKYAPHIPTLPLTCWQLFATAIVALVGASATETWPANITITGWGWLFASALLATCLRFTVQTKALQKVSASQASLISVLEPVWVTLLGATFLAESMTQQQMIGCALILTALIVYRSDQIKVFWQSLLKQ